jgi:RNA polymerase sigma-70 factor (ECF subfamily)
MERTAQAAARQAEDAALAVRMKAGIDETDTLAAAWRRFGPLVRGTLLKMLGPDEEIRDLSQEAFLQLYRSVPGLRSPDAIRPFVVGIAVRLALYEIRRRRVRGRPVLLPGQGPVPASSTTEDPEAREVMAGLLRVVGRLSAADRYLFVLREIEGLEQAQISEATQLSVSTVRRRLWRLQRRIATIVNTDPTLSAYAERAWRRGPGGAAEV